MRPPRQRTRQPKRGTCAALALLVTAGACSSTSSSHAGGSSAKGSASVAATVAGTKVPLEVVTADLKAESAAGKKGKSQTDPSNPLAAPNGPRPGTYTAGAKAAALTNRILYELYAQQFRTLGTKLTKADLTAAHGSLCADAKTGQIPAGSSCPPLAAYPAAYRTFQLGLRERELAFGKILYGRVFDSVQRTDKKVLNQVCVNLVQVADQTVSSQIQKAMKAGASITEASKSAAAAGKASQPQLGCLFIAAVPAALAKAKKGDIVPIQGQSVLGVASVTSFKTATKAEFAAQPPSGVAGVQKLVQSEVDRSLRRAKVTVDTKLGHWDSKQLIVVAPKAAKTSTTTTTKP